MFALFYLQACRAGRRIATQVVSVFLAAFLVAGCGPQDATTPPLPRLNIDLSQTTVSGISSGAYMAGQMQLAHGDIIVGAALIAGGPFGCAESAFSGLVPGGGQVFFNASRAISGCMLGGLQMWGVPNPARLARRAADLAKTGRIAALSHTARDRIYLFAGQRDRMVRPAIVRAAGAFYRAIGVPSDNIALVDNVEAGHAFITMDSGHTCATTKAPFVVDCDYDQAGSLLTHLYDGLVAPTASEAGSEATSESGSEAGAGQWLVFDQGFATDGLKRASMAGKGVVYIPPGCAQGGAAGRGALGRQTTGQRACRVHVAYHGCGQNRTMAGDAFVRQTGFSRWADANDIVVLFPQVAASALNTKGCWDWWGYTGADYLTNDAPQIVAVYRMLLALAGSADGA